MPPRPSPTYHSPWPEDEVENSLKRKRHSRTHLSRIPHLNHTASRWALLPVLLVVWMAPFLGGSVEPWAMGVLYCLLAALFIIYPVMYRMSLRYRLFLIAMLILPLTAFLPVALTGIPEWRSALTRDFGIVFPGTITPQPWLTLDSYLAWLGGVAWIYWLGGQGWTREIRKPLAEMFAVGMILLTAAGLIGYYTEHPLPFWHAQRLFGPFPNRNQTANLLSLSFIVLLALFHMAMVRKSRLIALWLGGLIIVGYGLIVNFSRAGILLPMLGAGIYWIVATVTKPSRKKIISGIAAFILGLALFLAFGGETLNRFTQLDHAPSMTSDFRRLIFRDTLTMTAQHPWFGVGLSSFPSVFLVFRKLADTNDGIIHPESDWLWLASEIGWPGTILVLGGSIWLVWRAFVGAFKRPHPLRLASAICALLFVFHGFFDVSGHRFGTFFPACFLFALAWPGQLNDRPISVYRSYGIALGLVLIAVGWLTNDPPLWPSRGALASVKNSVAQQINHGHGAEAYAAADAALRWAPLDWQLYYQRGTSHILERTQWAETLLDYQRANHLERFSPLTPDKEGYAWLSYRPELAALPWAEALRRMDTAEGDRKYAQYLDQAAQYPRLRTQLEAIAGNNIARIIIQLNHVDQKDFGPLLATFLKNHPLLNQLKPAEQRAFLDVWVGKGDPAEALATIEKTTGLAASTNLPRASAYARLKNFQKACEIAFQNLVVPPMPKITSRASENDLSKEFYQQKSLGTGMALYQMQIQRKDNYSALSTLERLQTIRDAPVYLYFFQARLLADNGNWEKAWASLNTYIEKSKQ